jgi:8-oxo-dGTP pyrophosphatase MutT (NUDIX family)
MTALTVQHIAHMLSTHTRTPLSNEGSRKACVMVTLVNKENHLHLLLTKRSETVEHHKGQISFPGGMVDDGDESETATAFREVEEEIGIHRSAIEVLGLLDDIHIPTGFDVTPVVGYIEDLSKLKPNFEEVAEVLLIPLEKFFDPALCRLETRILMGTPRQVFIFDVWNEPVWGATAHIIHQLTELVLSTKK